MDTTAGKEFKPQLKDGLVGGQMVKYFATIGKVPVDAKHLGGNRLSDTTNYRMTFEDGEVVDYMFTFSPDMQFHILSAKVAD